MASNEEVPIDLDNDTKLPRPKHSYNSSSNEDVAKLRVRLSTADEIEPKKFKCVITNTLQSWANKNSIKGEFTATEISDDGKTAVIRVTPADALKELLNLSGKELIAIKEKKKFSITPIIPKEQTQDDKKSSREYSSLTQKKAQNSSVDKPCLVALGPYWYMKNFYLDEIQRIEKENGVKITENVAATITADKKNANPKKASEDFIKLIQLCLDEYSGASIPLKKVGSEEFRSVRKQENAFDKGHKSPNRINITSSIKAIKTTKRDEKEEETCPVCMDSFTQKMTLKCKHALCEDCLERLIKTMGAICPVCKDVFGVVEGDQPDGQMTWRTNPISLYGFPGCGSIEITYSLPGGIQTAKHPNPGKRYHGTHRTAYLPDNKEGNEVLKLLRKAFDQKLIFTVGTSRTTGAEDAITWNDISHKTSMSGGPQSFGYPDPNYLSRVKDELKAKGIK